MGYLLAQGHEIFGLVKIGFTAVGLMFLLIHVRFRRVRAAVQCVLVLYCLLMLWHFWLRWSMLHEGAAPLAS
jgi:hypothetical protein